LYSRQIENSSRNTAAFLGLAQIRLKQSRPDEATDLLKRLNRVAADPFDNLLASARVLSVGGRPAEAQDFLKLRVQAAPWDDEARLELARAQSALSQRDPAVETLQKVVLAGQAPYDIRTQAAQEQAKTGLQQGAGLTGSRELDLLSGRIRLTPDAADAPYFFAARMAAAEQTGDSNGRVRLLLGAIAERPDDPAVRRLLPPAAFDARQYYIALAAYRRRDAEPDPETAAVMAEAYLQIGQPADAARFFGIAASRETETGRKQALEERRKQALAINDRMLENERRRPMIRAELDQPNSVRRRAEPVQVR